MALKVLQLSAAPQNLSGQQAVVIIMQDPRATPTTDVMDHHGNASYQDTTWTSEHGWESVWTPQTCVALVVIFLLVILTVVGNILVMASVTKFKRLQIPPNYILVNLAVADIGVAFMMPFLFAVNMMGEGAKNGYMCMVPYCIMSVVSSVSVLSLSIIAYDRYSALVEPLKYSSRITTIRISLCCLAVWLYVVVVTVIPFVGWLYPVLHSGTDNFCSLNFYHNYTILTQAIAIFLPALICMFICYCRVMLVARHHTRAISAVQFSLFPSVLNKNYNMFKGSKYWRTLALILGVFTFTWGTFICTIIIEVFCKSCAEFLTMHNYSSILLLINSSLNPWIYAHRNQDFKAAFTRVLRCFKRPCKKDLSRSNSSLVSERRNSHMSVALSRTNSLCGNLQQLQMLYEQEMALRNNNQQKNDETETQQSSVANSKNSIQKEPVQEHEEV